MMMSSAARTKVFRRKLLQMMPRHFLEELAGGVSAKLCEREKLIEKIASDWTDDIHTKVIGQIERWAEGDRS